MEQLSLRQVCKTTKEWIDASSLSYHAPVTIIKDHGSKTFTKFLQKKPPHVVNSIYIQNDSYDFLNDPALSHFMQIYGPLITSLRIQRYFPLKLEKDLTFYERFANLSDLELDKISIPSMHEVENLFPSIFTHLKTLKIGKVTAYPEPPADDSFGATLIPLGRQRPMGMYVWNLIRSCKNIEFLGYPRTAKYFFQAFIDGRGRGEFGVFCDYIRNRNSQAHNKSNLIFCDLLNYNWDPDVKNALPLLKIGNEFGVKFLNVNANLFQYIKIDSLVNMYDLPPNTGDCILSFRNFNCLTTKCLPSVERISMSASQVNTMLDYSCIFNGPKAFPNLREIEIIVDVGFTLPETDIYYRAREFRDVHILLSHFFYDMEMILLEDQEEEMQKNRFYENVHSLIIRFVDLKNKLARKASPEDLPLEWIIKSLPNLRKLKLQGWNVQREETYKAMWEGLPLLEELILDDCDKMETIFHSVDYKQLKSKKTNFT